MPVEPGLTALLLTAFGILLGISVLFSRATERFSVPAALVFLAIGILAGSEGLGGIAFEDYDLAFRLGTIALVVILFDGGLNTPAQALTRYLAPAGVLATIGVAGTAGLVAGCAWLLGFDWPIALLLGAVVSSTDAAAVFSVLRGSGIHLRRRVGVTLEVESGVNDPMAIILTMMLTRNLVEPGAVALWRVPIDIAIQMVVGVAFGLAIGYGGRLLIERVRLPAGGLYPALMLAFACLAFGLPTLAYGSGFLAVYVAGVTLGGGQLPYRSGLLRVHDALAWLSQIAMFLILGLLVFPSRLAEVWGVGLLLALFLAFIARPVVVALCLLPFRYQPRETLYVGWVGLRGAVPIILATYPVLAGAANASVVFDVVFFIVVVNAFVPGATVAWLTRQLRMSSAQPPPPQAVMQIESLRPMRGEMLSFYIDERLAVAGLALNELPFPDGASVALIVRDFELIPPRGTTVLVPGDHVHILVQPEHRPDILLLFGPPES